MKPCLSSFVKSAVFVLVLGFSKSLRKERERIDLISVISGFEMERVLQNLLSIEIKKAKSEYYCNLINDSQEISKDLCMENAERDNSR